MNEKYFEINENNNNIRAKIYFSDMPKTDSVIIALHGFCGHKDNRQCAYLAERVISKHKNFAMICFDLPCHGKDVKKKLLLSDCLDYFESVIKYAKETLSAKALYAFGVSFGGYLFLCYIKTHENPFCRAVLRSPAIDMLSSVEKNIIDDEAKKLLMRGKECEVGFDNKITINQKFLDDLQKNGISEYDFSDEIGKIMIIHGTNDEIASFDISQRFANKNLCEFVKTDGADHRFSNPKHTEEAIKNVLGFFDL